MTEQNKELLKKDVYNSESRLNKWLIEVKSYGIQGLSKSNSKKLLQYILDLKKGDNVSKKNPGPRSSITLNPKKDRITQWFLEFEKQKINSAMLINKNGKKVNDIWKNVFNSSEEMLKELRCYWNWEMLIERKRCMQNGKETKLRDITEDMHAIKKEPNFVYFTYEDLMKVQQYFNIDEQTINLFLYDTIIRYPTECLSVKVQDFVFHKDYTELVIREEIAKTYGRTIKLLLCSDAIKDYIERHKLKPNENLFDFDHSNYNKKLKKVFTQVLGNVMTKGGDSISNISGYDFRHSGSCHWRLSAYKTKIDALMYRGGWNNLEMLNYYTKKIGMRDSIEQSDLLADIDKNEFEKIKLQMDNIIEYLVNSAIGKKKVSAIERETIKRNIMNAMNYDRK